MAVGAGMGFAAAVVEFAGELCDGSVVRNHEQRGGGGGRGGLGGDGAVVELRDGSVHDG